jgi:hypothetical protein
MVECDAMEVLLEIFRYHQQEQDATRLIEALLNNVNIRDLKVVVLAIGPLSQYLLHIQAQTQQARLLVAPALGALFQNESMS